MLPEPLWPGIEFAWAEMIRADLYPVISWTRSKTHRFKTLKAFVWAVSLHHWEGEGVSAICSRSLAFLHLSLQLAVWTLGWILRPMATGKRRSLLNLPSPGKFSFPSSLVPMTRKEICRECRGHFRFWNYYFVLLTGKWHKGLGHSSGF